MTILDKLKWRYATKKFDNSKDLNKTQILLLKEAFNLTALSYGLQTLKLVIMKDRISREKLVPLAFNQRQVADASHLIILCIKAEISNKDVEKHFSRVNQIRKTPEHILSTFKNQLKGRLQKMSKQDKEIWATKQAYIALGNLMAVCALEQIDSCPMEGFNPIALDKALGLDKSGLKSVLLFPVGYRDQDDNFAILKKVRQPIDEVVMEL